MRVYGFILVSFVMATAALGLPVASAQSQGDSIQFIVPADTPVGSSSGGSTVAIFTGRPLGLIAIGSCGTGDHPLQNVVFVHPHRGGGAATTATVIVITATDPIPAGTQLDQIEALGFCSGPDGSAYSQYKGTVQ